MILLYAVYQVLAVQEKSGKFRGSGVWKFPTGVVDQVCKVPASTEIQRTSLALLFSTLLLQGEDLFVGAVREVKEETGVGVES